jgi:hypothetical protein
MGISLAMIEKMQSLGLFGKGRISVLDIGSSNLYSASADRIERFLGAHGVAASRELAQFAEKLAKGSEYDPVHGGINGSFVGELFEKAGMKYAAIDIADGYRTTILDLNHSPAPPHFVGAFELVFNFGTTEHLLNQYNAFRIVHDSTRVGGYMVHSLPGAGYSNHGYFTYTPRCFFDLAGYNEYEIADFWFEGPGESNDLYAPVRDYRSYFPTLERTLADQQQTETGRKIAALNIPDVGIVVVYRKVKARPFMGALEKSTSVGNVPNSVTSSYESIRGATGTQTAGNGAQGLGRANAIDLLRRARTSVHRFLRREGTGESTGAPVSNVAKIMARHDEIVLSGEAMKMREKFISRELTVDECMKFYELVVQSCGYFPYDWEEQTLVLALEHEPDRSDMAERLAVVRDYLARGVEARPNR